MNGSTDTPTWLATSLSSSPLERSSPFLDDSDAGKFHRRFNYTISSLRENGTSGCLQCQLVLDMITKHPKYSEATSVEVMLDVYKLSARDNRGVKNAQEIKFTTRLQGPGLTAKYLLAPMGHPFVVYTDEGKSDS